MSFVKKFEPLMVESCPPEAAPLYHSMYVTTGESKVKAASHVPARSVLRATIRLVLLGI